MLTDLAQANFWWTAIRRFWAFFDKMVYTVMGFVYQVFLNVASQNILGGTVTKNLIGRMQLIIGIIFLFILAINIVQGIVNPDTFTDKDRGTSKLIIRIIVSLMLIACMIPLNIPSASRNDTALISDNSNYTWENALAEQGILFGTLTFFQNKVLETNVLGKLILGSNAESYSDMNDGDGTEENNGLSDAGNYMTSGILRMFITPNQQSEDFLKQPENADVVVDRNDGTGFVCSETPEFSGDDGRLKYYNEEYETNYLFGYIDNVCTLDGDLAGTNLGDTSMAGDYYQFAYMGGYSTAVGIFVVFVLISFTVELAVRVFKLVVLRILGPVAAVTYVMPNSSSANGMFSSWVKQLFSTYIDVFLRVAIIYFCIFVVAGLLAEGINGADGIYNVSTGVGFTTMIFLIIGLFFFAKQAPKFIRQMFGMPDSDKGMFSGLSNLVGFGLGAAGIAGGIGGGALSRMFGNVNASKQRAEAEGKQPNLLKQFGAGALGLVTGGIAGGIGAMKADSNSKRFSAGLENVRQGNLLNMQRARAQSTARGRAKDRIATFLGGGESPLERDERRISNLKTASSTASALSDYVRNKGIANYGQKKLNFNYKDANGKNNPMFGVSYNELLNARNAAASRGEESFSFTDKTGRHYTMATSGEESDEMFKQMAGALGSAYGKAQLDRYNDDMKHAGEADYKPTADAGFTNAYNSAVENGVFTIGKDEKGIIGNGEEFNSYKLDKVAGAAKGDATRIENSIEHQRHLANNPNGPQNK